jgi:hypothetical protein
MTCHHSHLPSTIDIMERFATVFLEHSKQCESHFMKSSLLANLTSSGLRLLNCSFAQVRGSSTKRGYTHYLPVMSNVVLYKNDRSRLQCCLSCSSKSCLCVVILSQIRLDSRHWILIDWLNEKRMLASLSPH